MYRLNVTSTEKIIYPVIKINKLNRISFCLLPLTVLGVLCLYCGCTSDWYLSGQNWIQLVLYNNGVSDTIMHKFDGCIRIQASINL